MTINKKYFWNVIAQKFINSNYPDDQVDKFLIECCDIKPKKSILKRAEKWVEYRQKMINI